MTIRMTGLYSNLDTDSIISQLMSAQRTKIQAVEKKKTKLEWKVDAWSELNTKIYALYTSLDEMRFTSGYKNKTTSISNSSIATVSASSSAVDGTQELAVKQLAKSGYLTGAQISTSDSTTLSSSSTLSQLTGFSGTDTGSIQIAVGDTTTSIEVSESTTISEVITQLKSAGVNASFDATNKRIFVTSTASGADANFTISVSDTDTVGASALSALGLDTSSGATKIEGQDAEIILNGATFTSSSNAFSINGLNIVATETTGTTTDTDGNVTYNTVSISTAFDYQGLYDKIQSFFSDYNELIKEMDSLYNADSASGYEPLTDDEKDAMSDTQVEKWETKIKDALLRKDSTLSSVTSAMKNAMSKIYEIDGTNYSLASFGIATGSYFSTDADERGVYHIDGDSSDSTTSSNDDKLMAAITSDPDSVISFFSKLTQGLYSNLDSKMKSISGVRTAYKVYDDQTMDDQIDDYEDEIDKLEDKFTAMEDRYYSQFSAMETALAKLQSNSSALSSLLSS